MLPLLPLLLLLLLSLLLLLLPLLGCRDSLFGIVTWYGLDGGSEIFSALPDQHRGLPGPLYSAYRVFSGGKAAGKWC